MIPRTRLYMISKCSKSLRGVYAPSVLLFLFFDLPVLPAGRVAFCTAILVVVSGSWRNSKI